MACRFGFQNEICTSIVNSYHSSISVTNALIWVFFQNVWRAIFDAIEVKGRSSEEWMRNQQSTPINILFSVQNKADPNQNMITKNVR